MNAARKPFRVLFVCLGNICRSPAAEIIFHHEVERAGLADQIFIDSAGTLGYHTGKGPDPRMAATLAGRGYRIFGTSRTITARDVESFDLIAVMDEMNLSDVRALDPRGLHRDKIRLFTEFCTRHQADEVPDPYNGGQAGFERVADLVEDAARGLLASLAKPPGQS